MRSDFRSTSSFFSNHCPPLWLIYHHYIRFIGKNSPVSNDGSIPVQCDIAIFENVNSALSSLRQNLAHGVPRLRFVYKRSAVIMKWCHLSFTSLGWYWMAIGIRTSWNIHGVIIRRTQNIIASTELRTVHHDENENELYIIQIGIICFVSAVDAYLAW